MIKLFYLVDVNNAVSENDVDIDRKNPSSSVNPAYIGWVWLSLLIVTCIVFHIDCVYADSSSFCSKLIDKCAGE